MLRELDSNAFVWGAGCLHLQCSPVQDYPEHVAANSNTLVPIYWSTQLHVPDDWYVRTWNLELLFEVLVLIGFCAALVGSLLLRFWDSVLILCRRGSQPSWTASLLKMGPIRCPEMAVTNYQQTMHNIPEEKIPQVHCDRSLKSCIVLWHAGLVFGVRNSYTYMPIFIASFTTVTWRKVFFLFMKVVAA